MLDLIFLVVDDVFLDVVAHNEISVVVDRGARIQDYIHKGGQAAAEPRPQVFGLALGLGQLGWRNRLVRIFVVLKACLEIAYLLLHLTKQVLDVGQLGVVIVKGSSDGLL